MPQSKGLAAAIRVKAAHRTEAGEIHRVYETLPLGQSGMVMTTKINSDYPTSTTLHKVTNGLYAIRIEMREGMRGPPARNGMPSYSLVTSLISCTFVTSENLPAHPPPFAQQNQGTEMT
jgi:hypothetical protein